MSDKPVGKVLRPCKNLFGEPKEVDDLIWEHQTEGVKPHVLKALVSTGKVEWFVDSPEVEKGLDARIKILEKQVEDLFALIESAGSANGRSSTPKPKPKAKAKAKAK